MDNRKSIMDELTGISPLVAGIQPVHPYAVPVGYFDNFAGKLLATIRSMDDQPKEELEVLSPLLSSIGKTNPFTIPEGYFSNLPENLVAGVKAVDFVKEELETSLLNDLKHRPVYTVPPGYFESFPNRLMQKIRTAHPAPVVKMQPVRKIFQYAAAAAVVAMIVLGVVFFNNQQQSGSAVTAALPADSVATQNIDKLPDEAIINYVEQQGMLVADNNLMYAGTAEIDEEDMRDMLSEISNEELNGYVELQGGEKFLAN